MVVESPGRHNKRRFSSQQNRRDRGTELEVGKHLPWRKGKLRARDLVVYPRSA